MLPLPAHQPAAAVMIVAICCAGACIGVIVACACKAVDDWYSAGAEQRAKNRRTDKRVSIHLRSGSRGIGWRGR